MIGENAGALDPGLVQIAHGPDGDAVGFCYLSRDGDAGVVKTLAVVPEHRHAGLGSVLVAAGPAAALGRGVRSVVHAHDSVLAPVIRAHLGELEERIESDTGGMCLPRFAVDALRKIAGCGDFTAGFIRLYCRGCRRNRIVPFCCKNKLCPCCAGRVMNERAAFLVDRVLKPDLRWRQYVVTFPADLAVRLCFRAELAAAVTRVCMRVLFEYQRSRAPAAPGIPRPAAVVWVQRFSDGAGAWHHLHVLCPDGVFRQLPDSLDVPFQPQPPPTPAEVQTLVRRIARRVTTLVVRRANIASDDPLLERCATQPRKAVRIPVPTPSRAKRRSSLQAQHAGFSLHAATSIPPFRTDRLERLLRYLVRPPIPDSRLDLTEDGRVAFALKRPRRGVTEYLFDPLSFLARVAALVARPGQNQVLYFGALAPGSPIRSAVLPVPPDPTENRPVAPSRPGRMSHCDLLRRVFSVDLLECPCGGRLELVAVVTDPDVVQAVAAAITLSQQRPRGPPTEAAVRT